MRILWALLKVIVGLAIAIPVGILAMALMAGFVGTLFGLLVLAVKLACIGAVGYGLYRVARFMFSPKPQPAAARVQELPAPDPYYEAAMRELDAEFRGSARG